MTTSIKISIPHQLGRAEARRRIETGFGQLVGQVPGGAAGLSERWEGDRMSFNLSVMGQSLAGSLLVLDTEVLMDIALPGLLGMIAGRLEGRLRKAAQLLLTKQ